MPTLYTSILSHSYIANKLVICEIRIALQLLDINCQKFEMKDTEKLIFLRLIKQHRHKLVGRFSSGVSDADKKDTWVSIIEICRNQHGFALIPEGKDWKYVRDHSWLNIRNYSTQKIDSQKKTGAAGGKARLMTAVDDMVLDIIGKESPIMYGIGNNLETACGKHF